MVMLPWRRCVLQWCLLQKVGIYMSCQNLEDTHDKPQVKSARVAETARSVSPCGRPRTFSQRCRPLRRWWAGPNRVKSLHTGRQGRLDFWVGPSPPRINGVVRL